MRAGPYAVGAVQADGASSEDRLAYSLAAGGRGLFEVVAATGYVLYLGEGEDYEAGHPPFSLSVRATDPRERSSVVPVTVVVRDENEPPDWVGDPEPMLLEAGSVRDLDMAPYFREPNGDPLRWPPPQSSDPGVAAASISPAGLLTVSALAVGVSTIFVSVLDPQGASANQEVRVAVGPDLAERALAFERSLVAFARVLGSDAVAAIGGRLDAGPVLSAAGGAAPTGAWVRDCESIPGEECRGFPRAAPLPEIPGPVQPAAGPQPSARFLEAFGRPPGEAQSGSIPADPDELGPATGRPPSQDQFRSPPAGAGAGTDAADSAGREGGWTLWGRGSAGGIEAAAGDGFTLSGRTQSAWAGVDYAFGSRLMAGVAASRTRMESALMSPLNGRGRADMRLAALYPYLRWSPREGWAFWGLVGGGRGDVR